MAPTRRNPMLQLSVGFVVGLSVLSGVLAAPFPGTILKSVRDVADCYDYVIVGGGVSGLVVANRLTEDPDITVLVIEAGGIDNLPITHLYPHLIMDAGNAGNTWGYNSTPNAELNDKVTLVSMAKTLGGGSAINGMLFDRGSKGDYDIWGELLGDTDEWSWDSLLPYFKKSETFTPPIQDVIDDLGVTYDLTAHGTTGPVYSSFPPFIYETAKFLRTAAQQLGLPTPIDGANGEAIGAFWTPNSLHPTLRERSYARNTYHILSEPRSNYHVLPANRVTKILDNPEEGEELDLRWVEYTLTSETDYATAVKHVVKANREIILAAGAAHTPKILQLSGIGPTALLTSLSIPVLIDLGGVGENFQDHPSSGIAWTSDYVPSSPRQDPASTADLTTQLGQDLRDEYLVNRTGPWTVSAGNILGFFAASHIDLSTSMLEDAEDQDADAYLHSGVDSTVVAGYAAQKAAILRHIANDTVAVMEMTFSPTFSLNALMKPLSRGYVKIASADPFVPPLIDFRTMSNPFDFDMAMATVRWQLDVFSQAEVIKDDINSVPVSPSPSITDTALKASLRDGLTPTFAHLVGTCAMMKREEGGVVDGKLKVYGTFGKVRIVDASMIPVIPGTHTQSGVYAVAEKAADLIKEDW
ncbi:hypothetical protein DFH27DRAFT_199851 [Peziza echinospora]|nr:hypothetical protein DFH27DRAFT_199851 [Peziza echinospora]